MKDVIRSRLGERTAQFPNTRARRSRRQVRVLLGGWLIPALLSGLVLALYLTTLSDVHTFDALTYLRDVEHRSDFFLHPHHLLYSPTGWLFWQSWRLFGYQGRSELPLQVLNVLVATACGLGLYHLTLRLTRSVLAALISAGIFFFSYANWYFAVEVEVYLLALAWQLLALALLIELVTRPRPRTAPCLGLAMGVAALYHQVNGLLVPVVVAGVVLAPLSGRARLRTLVVAGLIAGAIVALGYGIVGIGIKGIRSTDELRRWMFLYTQSGLWGQAKTSRWVDLGVGLRATISTGAALPFWVGMVALLLLGWRAVRRWPSAVLICTIWIVGYAAFFIWWEPDNIEFWISALLPLWLLLGLAVASIEQWPRGRLVLAAAVLGLGVLGWHNYSIVERRGDAAFDRHRRISGAVRDVTVPSDLILEPRGILELYLPHYEARPNIRMIHRIFWENSNQLDPALGQLTQEVQVALNAGVAVLVGRDALDRGDVPPDRLAALWQPYRDVMEPAVNIDGTVHFWRIPSAPEVAARGGWDWASFDWGWRATNIDATHIDGQWCFNPQPDPMLSSPRLAIDAASIRAVEVTMSTTAEGQTAQLYYGGLDGQLREEHSLSWQPQGDGQPHTYRLSVSEAPGWAGTLTLLRLDPIAVGDGTDATRTCITSLRFIR